MFDTLTEKTILLRHHILSLLETGQLSSGDKLPGARKLAVELGISFLTAQHGLSSLVRDGVLEMLPRSGTFVQERWKERILSENVSIFNEKHRLPWLAGLHTIIGREIPGLRFTHTFRKSMLEINTTLSVQIDHERFMDLSNVLEQCFPDQNTFFIDAFAPFRVGGRLPGIPITFSPRVIIYYPGLFKRAQCPQPIAGWTWDTFMATVAAFKRTLPSNRILFANTDAYLWMNLVLRAGGQLFDEGISDPVRVDEAKTRGGLAAYRALLRKLGDVGEWDDYFAAFCRGEAAMMLAGREEVARLRLAGADGWRTAPLPMLPGGRDVTSQMTNLICVRKECTSPELARRYVSVMLSEKVQDYLGKQRHGIPVRKTSAVKSLDLADPRDALFAGEMSKVAALPPAVSTDVLRFLFAGVKGLLTEARDIDAAVFELAQAARVMLAARRCTALP